MNFVIHIILISPSINIYGEKSMPRQGTVLKRNLMLVRKARNRTIGPGPGKNVSSIVYS